MAADKGWWKWWEGSGGRFVVDMSEEEGCELEEVFAIRVSYEEEDTCVELEEVFAIRDFRPPPLSR